MNTDPSSPTSKPSSKLGKRKATDSQSEEDEEQLVLLITVTTKVIDADKYKGYQSLKRGAAVRITKVNDQIAISTMGKNIRAGLLRPEIAKGLLPLLDQLDITAVVDKLPIKLIGLRSFDIILTILGPRSFLDSSVLEFLKPVVVIKKVKKESEVEPQVVAKPTPPKKKRAIDIDVSSSSSDDDDDDGMKSKPPVASTSKSTSKKSVTVVQKKGKGKQSKVQEIEIDSKNDVDDEDDKEEASIPIKFSDSQLNSPEPDSVVPMKKEKKTTTTKSKPIKKVVQAQQQSESEEDEDDLPLARRVPGEKRDDDDDDDDDRPLSDRFPKPGEKEVDAGDDESDSERVFEIISGPFAFGDVEMAEAEAEAAEKMQKKLGLKASTRQTGDDILDVLFKEGAEDPSTLTQHPDPPCRKNNLMRSDLMGFQKQGLHWMIEKEHPKSPVLGDEAPVQLWIQKKNKKDQLYYLNVATHTTSWNPPTLARGGLLADEMGLGKTVQTIALIVTDDTGAGVVETPETPDEDFDDMTLIVCPLSVASNWTTQFHNHVGSKRLKWLFFHGDAKTLTLKDLKAYDVVIATYQTVTLEWAPERARAKPKQVIGFATDSVANLFDIAWRRIVLDEGHVIKNPAAKMTKACNALNAERRWILTGTPIVNSASDLGSMMTFLRSCSPLDEPLEWKVHVTNLEKTNPEAMAKILRAVVSSTTLRRTKDMLNRKGKPLVKLPPLQYFKHLVILDPAARAFYDEVAGMARVLVAEMLKDDVVGQSLSETLVYLLRLRQLACDPSLCPPSFIDQLRTDYERLLTNVGHNEAKVDEAWNSEFLRSTLRRLTVESNEPCSICQEKPFEPRITECRHIYCAHCLDTLLEEDVPMCKVCAFTIQPHHVVDLGTGSEDLDEQEVLQQQKKNGLGEAIRGAKTQQLIAILKATERGVKSLVFSQWTTHLNLITAALTEAGIVSCRFDGSMSSNQRENVITSFSLPPPEVDVVVTKTKGKKKAKKEPEPPSVMLISLKAGALGLNLTCASQVFLMDPWWQASIESQAIDRVHRIGQRRNVKVFQLIAENTVESRVLAVQQKKEDLIRQAFSGNKNAPRAKEKIETRIKDIAEIFGV